MNIACIGVGNRLIVGHLLDLVKVILLVKEAADWDTISFVKLWVDCNYRWVQQ